jgi:YcxB-like protein
MTLRDIEALDRYQRSRGMGRFIFIVQKIAVPAIFVFVPLNLLIQERSLSVLPKVIPVFIPVMALWFGLTWFFNRQKHKELKKSGVLDEEAQMALLEEGLWRKDSTGEGTTFWSFIEKIADYKDHFVFVLKPGTLASIVPKSCFATPEAAQGFYQEAIKLWQCGKESRAVQ